jgi:hypothetical protein
MAIDINDGYEQIGDEIQKNKTYKKLQRDYKRLKKKTGSTFEKNKAAIMKRFNDTKKKVAKAKKDSATMFDKLLDLKFESADDIFTKKYDGVTTNLEKRLSGGGDVKKYIVKTFMTALKNLKPEILKLLEDEVLNTVGCSQNQTYVPNQDLYIKIKTIDYLGQLKVDPASDVGKVIYEPTDLSYPTQPFPMNKELYNRIQNLNQPFSVQYATQYQGTSTQNLFDITYVDVNDLNENGDFYKVVMANRVTGNTVKSFLKDYYSTLEVIDFKNILGNLMNILTGAISIQKGDGKDDTGDFYKIFLIIQRVMGLCYDGTKEIDVSGSAKISEIDNIDDAFFEFTEVDLNFIDQKVSDVSNSVTEFVECDNVKLPVNSNAIIEAINNLIFVPGSNNNDTIQNATDLTDSLTQNPDWLPLKINIDLSFIKEFPKAVIFSVLSPKTILPLAIVLKSLGNNILDGVTNYYDFVKKFSQFFTTIASKVGGIFVKILYDLILQDIKNLIKDTIADIKNDKTNKRLAVILALTEIITTIAKIFKDIRECKNVIDSILNALKLFSKSFGNEIPLPLLLSTKFLSGYSSSRAYLNVIGEFDKLGIPTGPMSDGSPNEFMASVKAILDGIDKEEAQNGQVQVGCDSFSVTPIGVTIPGFCYGKKM